MTDENLNEELKTTETGVASDGVNEEVRAEEIRSESEVTTNLDRPLGESEEVEAAQSAEAADEKETKKPRTKNNKVSEEVAKEAAKEDPEEIPDSAQRGTGGKAWYILKVQVNREDGIRDNLVRRVKLTGLERFFDEILVPTEKVTTVKNGKKRVTKRKLYPGYLMVNMEINDETWFLVRETAGIGDFTGAAGKPVPMLPHEVQRILQSEKADTEEAPVLKIPYEKGDLVKITDGTFKETEGEVSSIDLVTGRITVNITIFSRTTPIELEYWQVEKVG